MNIESSWSNILDQAATVENEPTGDIPVSIFAYGKAFHLRGAHEFGGFNLEPSEKAKQRFERYIGALTYADEFALEKPDFLRTIDEARGYPPAIVVTRDRNAVVICGVRNLVESALSGEQMSRTQNRLFVDYRAAALDTEVVTALIADNTPWVAAFAGSPLLHELETRTELPKIQSLSFTDASAFYKTFESLDSGIGDFEQFSHMYGLSLLSVKAHQPIIIEQQWSLQEKVLFIQILQQSLYKCADKQIISWSSEPIVSATRGLDIIFKSPGESVIDPHHESWFDYKTLSETTELVPEEAELMDFITRILRESGSIAQAEESIAQMFQYNDVKYREIEQSYRIQSAAQRESALADQKRRYALVRGQFMYPDNLNINQAFIDWVCPPGADSLLEDASLPPSYLDALRRDTEPTYFMHGHGNPVGLFLMKYLEEQNGSILFGLKLQKNIHKKIYDYISQRIVSIQGDKIRVNIPALCAALDLANAVRGSNFNKYKSLDDLLVRAFEHDNPVSVFQADTSEVPMNKNMLQQYFQGVSRADAGAYLGAWRVFVRDCVK